MITAIPMLMCSPVASQLYNITVTCIIHPDTCIIHPDSTADQCVVMAMADGRVTRTGEIHTMTVISVYFTIVIYGRIIYQLYVRAYVCMYKLFKCMHTCISYIIML